MTMLPLYVFGILFVIILGYTSTCKKKSTLKPSAMLCHYNLKSLAFIASFDCMKRLP